MDGEATRMAIAASYLARAGYTRKDFENPAILELVFDSILIAVHFTYDDRDQNLKLIMGSCACARDVYTFFLSLAADKLANMDLYEFSLALWDRYQGYSPRPRLNLTLDRTIVCAWNYPTGSFARYTLNPPRPEDVQVVMVPGAETVPSYTWLPIWAQEKIRSVCRPFCGKIGAIYPDNSIQSGCVILCTVFRTPGTPTEWDSSIDRLVKWDGCLSAVSKICKAIGIREVHIHRQIGRFIEASAWNRYEGFIHRWANKKRAIKVFIHV